MEKTIIVRMKNGPVGSSYYSYSFSELEITIIDDNLHFTMYNGPIQDPGDSTALSVSLDDLQEVIDLLKGKKTTVRKDHPRQIELETKDS